MTRLYLVHVSICATSHPLNELEVVLRVLPLDFSVGPGEHVHGGSSRTFLHLAGLIDSDGGGSMKPTSPGLEFNHWHSGAPSPGSMSW